jgi:hypothetical protein
VPRASFTAVSTASDPELVRKTRASGIGHRAAIAAATASAGSLVKMSNRL